MAKEEKKQKFAFSKEEIKVPKEMIFGETMEKRQKTKPLNEMKEPSIEQKGIPLYIVALLVLLALVGAYAAFSFINSPTQPIINEPINENNANDENFVKIISVYSAKCAFCEKNTTLILSFQSRNVKMQIESVEINSQKGKQLLEFYELGSVPITLVEEQSIKEYPDIYASLKSQKLENGYFIVPELYLDSRPHNKMFLEAQEPASGTPALMLFLDFANNGSYEAFKKTQELRQEFGEDLNIVFRNFVLGGEEAEMVALGSECAKLQGEDKQLRFIERAYFYIFDDQNMQASLYPSDILKIGYEIGDKNDFSLDDFIECFGNKQTKHIVHSPSQYDEDQNVGTDNLAALNTYVIGFVPAFVIDSQFVTYDVAKIKEELCSVRRELKACKAQTI